MATLIGHVTPDPRAAIGALYLVSDNWLTHDYWSSDAITDTSRVLIREGIAL